MNAVRPVVHAVRQPAGVEVLKVDIGVRFLTGTRTTLLIVFALNDLN